MNNNKKVLMRTIFRASGYLNIWKYSKDKKKRGRAVGNLIGFVILDLMLAAYMIAQGVGMIMIGLEKTLPSMTALAVVLLSFLLTLLKAGPYLFGMKDYDMLMAMPFQIKEIVTCKFLYMYLNTLKWTVAIELGMLIAMALTGKLTVIGGVFWLVLAFVLPLVPMVLASALSVFITAVGSRFRNKSIVQSILTIIIVVPLCFSNAIITNIVKNNDVSDVMTTTAGAVDVMAKWLPTVRLFSKAVTGGGLSSVSSFLLALGSSILIFELFLLCVSRFYRQINSRLSSSVRHGHHKAAAMKQHSPVVSIAYKELRRMLGSAAYLTNIGIGVVMCVLIGIAALIFDAQTIVSQITQGAPVNASVVIPAIPFAVYFFSGMVATTAITPSLEGKNDWIIKSLPIDPMDDCKGKMLFNLCLLGSVSLFAVLALDWSFGAGWTETVLSVLLIAAMNVFSANYGMICGIKHKRLDWENEIEVIKRGAAVTIYLLPNMFSVMILCGGAIAAGFFVKTEFIFLAPAVLYALLAAVMYRRVVRIVRRNR